MANKATTTVLKQVQALFQTGTTTGLTDGSLLERFADRRRSPDDMAEAAFAALVDRHAAMVLRTCRGVLGDEHAAEDAAKAAFLVLARRAGVVARRDSVGAWLHGVALRVATKARVAAARRRLRESRGGAIAAVAMAGKANTVDDPDRWVELHEELGRLPERFRAPLVLCYFEGLTQEQAAAQLRWPLGTVQSRLARGRAKLKGRLVRRGVAPAVALLDAGAAMPSQAAPAPWVEATVRAATAFSTRESWAVKAGAGPASAGVALEVLREMAFIKLRIVLAATLVVTVAITSAAALAWPQQKDSLQGDIKTVQAGPPPPTPLPPPTPPSQTPNRTVRGVVRDDQGRPLGKVWVGSDPRPSQDIWDNPRPEDIRERKEPFRDGRGNIIPPGAVGKYFEVRDRREEWHPISPDDIRPWEAIVFGGDGQAVSKEEVAKIHSAYTIRVAPGGWWMAGMPEVHHPVRTDAEGRFTTTFTLDGRGRAKLHFASADYTLQAIHVVKAENADEPLDITLKPTRLVRARVIEVPKDDPKAYLNWTAYRADAVGKVGDEWQRWMLPNRNANDPDHVKRHLDVRLPTGRCKIEFRSLSVLQVIDIEVPPGDGPLDLPDMMLESLASVRMVGKPAAEIEATDLDGKPIKLADFRGKVVVLDFWATWCGPCIGAMPRLMEIEKRFRDRPVVFVALHDGSLPSAEAYKKVVVPLRDRFWGGADLPFRVLLDRRPSAKGKRPFAQEPGEKGSGRTADTYEVYSWPSTFVIAPDGRLIGKFELDALEGALEEQLGLPRTRPAATVVTGRAEPPQPRLNVKVKGKVVGPEGQPVTGAKLSPQQVVVRQKGITTGPTGEFEFMAERILIDHFALRVEAPGLASRMFTIPVTGEVPTALKLGVGAVVTGRVLRDGKPAAEVPMRLSQVQRGMGEYLGELKAETDGEGRFRFPHAFAGQELYVYAETGHLKDHGAITPRFFKTGDDDTAVDLGDFAVKPGRRLAGRVVFADGKAVPAKTTVFASPMNAFGLLRSKVDDRGRFEFLDLPDWEVNVSVRFPGIDTWLPPGYRLSPRIKSVDPLNPWQFVGQLDRDVTDLTILFEPGEQPKPNWDAGLLEDFKEAKTATITGVPPGSTPSK